MDSVLVDFLVAIPGIIQDPGGFALRKGAEGMHPHLVGEPIQRISRGCHVIAAAEFVLVRNHVHHRIQAVNIRAYPDRFLLDAGINFGNCLDLGIDRLRIHVNLVHEIGESLDAEIHPLAEVRRR